MNFQSLSSEELQLLCKKNKIPANMTIVEMADALAALPNVEGREEIGNSQSVLLSPQTCKGTSKMPINQADSSTENEPKSSVTVTRTRRGRSILKTPATRRTTRRRPAGATSVCKNNEGGEEEEDGKDEEKTVGTRGHTTGCSTRLVSEKKGKSITEAFEISDENDQEPELVSFQSLEKVNHQGLSITTELHGPKKSKSSDDEDMTNSYFKIKKIVVKSGTATK